MIVLTSTGAGLKVNAGVLNAPHSGGIAAFADQDVKNINPLTARGWGQVSNTPLTASLAGAR
jgi:hypothetical protein